MFKYSPHGVPLALNEDEDIISKSQVCQFNFGVQRMIKQETQGYSFIQHSGKHLNRHNKQIWRDRIALSEPFLSKEVAFKAIINRYRVFYCRLARFIKL